ncbi:visual pigment-like receptor peropsin [Ptychodera flava]|uniref:visual pigment-like receptor peropsin n=1 Tax=Ptychodera flava TaxID=63121 RepID=UPI00396A58C3
MPSQRFISVMGNIIVITLSSSARQLRKSFNILLINLALSDLGINLFSLPLSVTSSFAGQWLFGDQGCKVYGALMFMFSINSINTLAIISYVRFIAISWPTWDSKVQNRRYIAMAVSCSWIYSVLWSCAPLLGWSAYTLEPFNTSCSIDWYSRSLSSLSYNISIFISCFGVQLAVIVRCYWLIWRRGSQALRRRRAHWRCKRTTRRISRTQNRLLKMCVIVVILYFVAWIPYAVLSIWTLYFGMDPNIAASVLPSLIAKSSTVYNPIVYVLMHKNVKKAANVILFCCSAGVKRLKVVTSSGSATSDL